MSLEHNLLDVYENILAGHGPRDTNRVRKSGEFAYIPLNLAAFEAQIQQVRGFISVGKGLKDGYDDPHPDFSFIDVGCGIGSKVFLAREFVGYRGRADGIERHKPYVRVARRLLKYSGCSSGSNDGKIICGNAITADFSKWDVIYFYCPIADVAKQQQLEKRIITTAKPGAYILANLKKLPETTWSSPPLERVWGRTIYRKLPTK